MTVRAKWRRLIERRLLIDDVVPCVLEIKARTLREPTPQRRRESWLPDFKSGLRRLAGVEEATVGRIHRPDRVTNRFNRLAMLRREEQVITFSIRRLDAEPFDVEATLLGG